MPMLTVQIDSKNNKDIVKKTVEVLEKGGLVIAPSDTVYGVLVDATNEEAVRKLIQFKNRPIGKSISVFVADFQMLNEQVNVSTKQKKVLQELLPGPFTIVLLSRHKVSKLLEAEKGTLGVRLIDYSFIEQVLKQFGKPTSATSANLSGKSPHYSAQSLLNQLPQSKKNLIDLVVDAGQLPRNKPSTVLDLTTPTLKVLRQGDIVWNEEHFFHSSSENQTKKIAQFILEKYILSHVHKKPVVIILKGDLGAGKTIFVKGVAEKLGVTKIVSPTFTIYYEYKVNKQNIKMLYHYDLYNVEDAEEFKYLGVKENIKLGNIIFFEWGEKSGAFLETLQKKSEIIFIEITYKDQTTREIKLSI
jgi:L-threonylcarbamoyladenylate synthase